MKLLVIIVSFVALCAGSAIPLVPGDNSHYVEGESRYIWMPDGEGVPHLVDLQAPADEEELQLSRNGANNQYWLFTRSNPTSRQILTHGNINSIRNSNYVASRPLRVIVHGWNSNGNSNLNPLITRALLATCDCNVIVLDWRRAAGSATYLMSARAVRGVGQYLGNFLAWLINNAGGNWNNVHLIGFSLGAHVVGNAGRTAGRRPARITGLDPAGPNFGGNSDALNANDGQYVEAIHTDGGTLGIFDPIGRTNFYPNGGRSQPGCLISTCNHSRAYDIFAASIYYSNRFVGHRCADLNEARRNNCRGTPTLHMGNDIISKRGNGLHAMTTGRSWPF